IPAKLPRKSTHGVDRTPKMFAAITPNVISRIATETPDSTDAMDAITTRPAKIIAVAESVTDPPFHVLPRAVFADARRAGPDAWAQNARTLRFADCSYGLERR